jgi:hypothetical protein
VTPAFGALIAGPASHRRNDAPAPARVSVPARWERRSTAGGWNADPQRETTTMEHDALNIYLNDHLAGATLGIEHARQLENSYVGSDFGIEMSRIADEIEEDRETLLGLMERLDAPRDPVKKATAWVAEKAGRLKFSGLTSRDRDLGTYLALETMSLGVEGKLALWSCLAEIAPEYPQIAAMDLERLIERARNQRAALEHERLSTARRALSPAVVSRS